MAAKLQSKTVTPTAAGLTVLPDDGFDGLSEVVINGDSDLVAANIKSGVNIFGVAGSYVGANVRIKEFSTTVTSGTGSAGGKLSVSGIGFLPKIVCGYAYDSTGTFFAIKTDSAVYSHLTCMTNSNGKIDDDEGLFTPSSSGFELKFSNGSKLKPGDTYIGYCITW